jgi:hypothetical protein
MVHIDRLATPRDRVSDVLLAPGDSGYEEARPVFNAMIDRRPGVIARCASTSDVVAAVNFARDEGLVIAVPCGGHSVAGLGTCDDGVLVDLRGLNPRQRRPGDPHCAGRRRRAMGASSTRPHRSTRYTRPAGA